MKKPSELEKSLLGILDDAIAVDGAAKGDIQVFNPELGGLQIVAQRGFDSSFLYLFELVRMDEPSVCSRAWRHRRRMMVPDVTEDVYFTPYLSIANTVGFRAVQSTPVFAEDGSLKGVISTHYAQVHHWSDAAMAALDDCASRMAALMDHKQPIVQKS